MRIALLSTFHETCGIATYAESLVHELEVLGARVEVLSPFLREGVTARGEQPRRLWSASRATAREALATFAQIRRFGAEVVHVQMNHGLYSPRFLAVLSAACRASGLPVFTTLHGRRGGDANRRRAVAALERALLRGPVIVHNASHAREIGPRAHVIAHGVPLASPSDLEGAKARLGIDPGAPVLAHFGFLHPDKGIEEVIDAVAALRSGAFPALRYHIIGGTFPDDASQRYLTALTDQIRRHDLAQAVRLPGVFQCDEEVVRELQAADWIVLNYRTGNRQGTSGAARHALAAGRPIAVSRAPLFDDLRPAAHSLEEPLDASLGRLFEEPGLAARVQQRLSRHCDESSWSVVAREHLRLFEAAR